MANNNGLRLLRTCVDHDLVVTNTFFKHPDARTATWLSPGVHYWATKEYNLVLNPLLLALGPGHPGDAQRAHS